MVMCHSIPMEKVNEKFRIRNKNDIAIWVWKVMIWHRIVINTKHLIYVDLILFNFIFRSILFAKDPNSVPSIIHEGTGKLRAP
jgi:hypothetical protein